MRQLPNSSCVVSAPQTCPETRMAGAPSLVTIVNTPSGSVLSPMGICLSVAGSRWPSLRGPSHVSQPERSLPLNKDFHGTFGFADPAAGGSAATAASAQVARQTSAFIFLMLSISGGAHGRAKGPKPPTDRCAVRWQNLSGSGVERGDRVSRHDSIQRSGGQAKELGGNTCRVPRGRVVRPTDTWKRTSNIEHPTSNVQHRTSNIEHPTSNIQHRTSNTEHEGCSAGLRSWARTAKRQLALCYCGAASRRSRSRTSALRMEGNAIDSNATAWGSVHSKLSTPSSAATDSARTTRAMKNRSSTG